MPVSPGRTGRMKIILISVFVTCFLLCLVPAVNSADSETKQQDKVLYAGLRRSSYGLKQKNSDDTWWTGKARDFAAAVSRTKPARPVIIEIVAHYMDDGTCRMEFEKPKGYKDKTPGLTFDADDSINHERALTAYDRDGVSAIIQFEPGNADVMQCLDIANRKFGHHPCVIGYGVDAEWFLTKESADKKGVPLKDADARKWVAKVVSFNPGYILFLKHWSSKHMPPEFRHSNLWFLSDSQGFENQGGMMKDFGNWGEKYTGHVVGFQFGYKADSRWWEKMDQPAFEISASILKAIPNTRFLIWADFTADKLSFPSKRNGVKAGKVSDGTGAEKK